MNYRELGRTGLKVSSIAMGTVSLGVEYGIAAPKNFGIPPETEAINLLKYAADEGINIFDTAPAYGDSERLLGLAVGKNENCYIATKILIPKDAEGAPLTGSRLRHFIYESLENSLSRIRRDVLDIVQIHNATLDVIGSGEVAGILLEAKQRGILRFLGASVYTEDEAMAVIKDGFFDTVQVAYNMLDRRMENEVFPASEKAGLAIMARSALLKGVLTEKARYLPLDLEELKNASEELLRITGISRHCLAEFAIRFCLSDIRISTIFIGARTREELKQAIFCVNAGQLSGDDIDKIKGFNFTNKRLLNPASWTIP